MPARDTYEVTVKVTGQYDEAPSNGHRHVEYLSPGQDSPATMADVLRAAALELSPEGGDTRSDVAIYAALDGLRAKVFADSGFPHTRALLIGQLWDVAAALNLEWYGAR